MAKKLELEIRNQCAILILNRPEIRNAFDDELIANLAKTLKRLDADVNVRAVVLMGAGPAFCAGADLNWMKRMAGYTLKQIAADDKAPADMPQTLARLSQPTISPVPGPAPRGRTRLRAAPRPRLAARGPGGPARRRPPLPPDPSRRVDRLKVLAC